MMDGFDQSSPLPGSALGGVMVAKVKQTADPQGLGRITVLFQIDGALLESDWLQVMSCFAGPASGAFFLPKEGDSAVVAFARGDTNQPFVLGFLWNGGIKPPVEGAARQQDVRVIRTRQGKQVLFDDSKDGQLTLTDEKGNKVQIDTANDRIVLESKGDVSITAANSMTLKANQVVIQNTSGSVKLDLSAASLQAQGGQSMRLAATMIELN